MAEKQVATDEEKAALTKAAEQAVELSLSLPVAALPTADGLAIGINQQLDNIFQPFEGSGSEVANTATNIALGPVVGLWRAITRGKWSSSQTIRSNCQAARSNVKSRSGQADRGLFNKQSDVSILDETFSNVASQEFINDVKQRADFCASNPLKCAATGVADPTANLLERFWNSVPFSAKITGGALLCGIILFYFGPLIRVASTVTSKIV